MSWSHGGCVWIVCFEPEHVACGATRLGRIQKEPHIQQFVCDGTMPREGNHCDLTWVHIRGSERN